MGRQSQSRQARRAQERRQREREGDKGQSSATARVRAGSRAGARGLRNGPSWSLVGGGAVILAALIIFGLAVSGAFKGSANAANTNGTLTLPTVPAIAGVHCDQGMTSSNYYHIHAHIAIYVKGVQQTISPDFGHDYNDDCLFWVHAHPDENGIVHMESPNPLHPTLATWHAIAQKTLPQSGAKVPPITAPAGLQTRAYVDLKPYHGDPTQIRLYKHTQVVLEFGPPWVTPKPFTFPSGL